MPQSTYGFLEWSSIISNLAVALAAILGIYGFWQWRRELIGKSKFKVARKMMMLAQQFRVEYGNARDFWTYPGEATERIKGDDEMPKESFVLNERFARWRRLQPLQNTLNKLWEASWEAEVVLTEEDANLVQLFQQLFKDLYLAIEIYFEAGIEQLKIQSSDNIEIHRINHPIIYGAKDDEFSKKADDAVDTVKKQLKKYIQPDSAFDIVKKFLKGIFI